MTLESKKVDYFGKVAYLYRDFLIMNQHQFYNMQSWRVKFPNGKEVYSSKNKREGIEWVDDYYQEMDKFVNSQQLTEIN